MTTDSAVNFELGKFARQLMKGVMYNYDYFYIEDNVYHAEKLFKVNAIFRWVEKVFIKNIINPEDIERYISAAYEYLEGNIDIEWYYGNPLIWEHDANLIQGS